MRFKFDSCHQIIKTEFLPRFGIPRVVMSVTIFLAAGTITFLLRFDSYSCHNISDGCQFCHKIGLIKKLISRLFLIKVLMGGKLLLIFRTK